jgi:hypothetical protein
MGVRTTADEKLDAADEHMRQAVMALSEIVVDECYGHDEYNAEFSATINQTMFSLIELRRKLDR